MDTTIQIVHTGERNAIVHLTGRATDAVQESDVVKVDISELLPPARRVALRKIEYAVSGGQVTLACPLHIKHSAMNTFRSSRRMRMSVLPWPLKVSPDAWPS